MFAQILLESSSELLSYASLQRNVGTMFGGGAYLAEASSKSDEYSTQDPSGVFKDRYAFLLCRVTLGNMFYITESYLANS